MLGASAQANGEAIDLRAVAHEAIDSGLVGGRILCALTEAAVLRDSDEMAIARGQSIAVLGEATTSRAIAVAANFEMMNRLLDAVGIGPPPALHPVGGRIGVPLPARFA